MRLRWASSVRRARGRCHNLRHVPVPIAALSLPAWDISCWFPASNRNQPPQSRDITCDLIGNEIIPNGRMDRQKQAERRTNPLFASATLPTHGEKFRYDSIASYTRTTILSSIPKSGRRVAPEFLGTGQPGHIWSTHA